MFWRRTRAIRQAKSKMLKAEATFQHLALSSSS